MMELQVGSRAPHLDLEDCHGRKWTLEELMTEGDYGSVHIIFLRHLS